MPKAITRSNRATKKDKFLSALSESGIVGAACDIAGIGRRTVYEWRSVDDAFAAKGYEALQNAGERLEAEARKRAVNGSDTLLIFLLKGIYPEKYRDRYDVRSENKVTVKHDADSLSDDELEAIASGRGVGVTA